MPASASAVLEAPEATVTVRPAAVARKPRRQPRYHVVLWNDDDHTYDYVIAMLRRLFGHAEATAFKMAAEVDTRGRVIVLTTTKEHAELKRDRSTPSAPTASSPARRARCGPRSSPSRRRPDGMTF
jgi:ATP-dependent Clp protease adaptor protein ClpS